MTEINNKKLLEYLLNNIDEPKIVVCIEEALEEQGLKYENGEIVSIEPEFKIEEGTWYMCIRDGKNFKKGKIYRSNADGFLTGEGDVTMCIFSPTLSFRPATKEEISEAEYQKQDKGIENALRESYKEIEEEPEQKCEDEKIKKAIKKALQVRCDGSRIISDEPVTLEEAISWLEKQGEQNLVEWSEEDATMLNDCVCAIQAADEVDYSIEDKDLLINWLKSLKDRCLPQQKQEWSEDDEHRREDAIYFLETAKKHYASTSEIELTIDWLKSLRPQKQEQWNEQDIDMIDWLIRCCEKEYEELCNDRYGHQEIVSDLKRDCRKKWDWLESLKSKVVPQKQWKPSEEQMRQLHKYCIDNKPLNELYEHLKAL